MPNIKNQMAIFLSLFAVILIFADKDWAFLFTLAVASGSAVIANTLFSLIQNRKLSFSSNALITGLIIGFVLAPDPLGWRTVLASLLAIGSKFVLRFQKKHIFNPAAFGVLAATLFLGAATQWKGTYIWPVLVPVGLYFAYKFRKLELLTGYAVISIVLFGIQAFIQKVPLLNIFGYFSYFFIFIMMIEPKTTPIKSPGKSFFGLGVGILIFAFTQLGLPLDVELAALLVLNIGTPFLNKIPAVLLKKTANNVNGG